MGPVTTEAEESPQEKRAQMPANKALRKKRKPALTHGQSGLSMEGRGFEQTNNPSWKTPFLDQGDVNSDESPAGLAFDPYLGRLIASWDQLNSEQRLRLVQLAEGMISG